MIMSIVMQFLTMGGLFTLFKNQVVGHLISADILNVNFFFFQTVWGLKHLWGCVLSVESLWAVFVYSWVFTDEQMKMLLCYATLPWLAMATKRHVWFSRGTARFQVAAVSSGSDASLHLLLPNMHSKQSPGWS